MDFGKSLTYMFDDERALNKLLIGSVVNLVPVLSWAATGYMVRTLRNVAARAERPLPDWDDVGGDLAKGFLVTLAGIIYTLPLLVLVALGVLLFLPISAATGAGAAPASETWSAVAGLGAFGATCLAVPYALFMAVWMPAATARYAVSGEFGAFFRLREIWALIKRNPGNYIVALLVLLVVGQLAGWVGALILIVGAAFTGFWTGLVYAHLLGQIVREDDEGMAPAVV